MIARALAEQRVSKDQALFIGDSPEDLLAAQAGGVAFAGVHGKTDFAGEPVPNFKNLGLLGEWLENR